MIPRLAVAYGSLLLLPFAFTPSSRYKNRVPAAADFDRGQFVVFLCTPYSRYRFLPLLIRRIKTPLNDLIMGHMDAHEPSKQPLDTASTSGCSTTKSKSSRKRKRTVKKRRLSSSRDVQDPRDELAANGTKQPPRQRSPSPDVDADDLSESASGTQNRVDEDSGHAEERLEKMCGAVRTLLECVGEDPDREGLLATPLRYAKALLFLTKGYQEDIKTVTNNAFFHERRSGMVIVKDIEIYSLCEHHLVPFTGKVRPYLSHIIYSNQLLFVRWDH